MARSKGVRRPAAQKKPPLTHFLCVPLVTTTSKPQLETSFNLFRDAVCTSHEGHRDGDSSSVDRGADLAGASMPTVHPKAIRPVGALHCTLGVMSLSRDRLKEAVELLESLSLPNLVECAGDGPSSRPAVSDSEAEKDLPGWERPISPPPVKSLQKPLRVNLKGLSSMHAVQKTSILYVAPHDSTDRLYPFCLALQKQFDDNDLLVKDDPELKLHATVVNTIYAKGRKRPPRRSNARTEYIPKPEVLGSVAPTNGQEQVDDRAQGHGPGANAPLKIDATGLLETFKDYVWAEDVVLDRIAICEMGAKKITDAGGNVVDEQYTEVACVKLPS